MSSVFRFLSAAGLNGVSRSKRQRIPLPLKIALFLHVPLLVFGINYFSPSSPFQSYKTIPDQMAAIKSGHWVGPRASERILRSHFIADAAPYDILAFGSSRGLAIDWNVVGTRDFLNVAASYGTLFDLVALYSIFERTDRFPKRLLLQLDGWMLNPNIKAQFWRDYGADVERGFRLLGMHDEFSGDLEGTSVWLKQFKDDFTYLASPAVFRSNLAETVRRLKDERSLSALSPTVVTRPINVETDGWASDLSYWYPSMTREAVRQRAERWATDRATAGEQLLDGGFTSLDSKRMELLRSLIKAFQSRNVKLFIFLHPFHPVSYNAMNETIIRRMHVEAEKVFRSIARETGVPVFGSYDPSPFNVTGDDFATDAMHVRPDVMKRMFDTSGLSEALKR